MQILRILWSSVQHAQTTRWHKHMKINTACITKQVVRNSWCWYIFYNDNNTLLYIVDYYSKFPVMKRFDGLPADDLEQPKLCSQSLKYQIKIVSDAGTNIMSDQCKQFFRQLNIDWAITSSYHQQNNGQVEACINMSGVPSKMLWQQQWCQSLFVADTIDVNCTGLYSPTTLFNRPIRDLLPQIIREPINFNAGNENYEPSNCHKINT